MLPAQARNHLVEEVALGDCQWGEHLFVYYQPGGFSET